jgi:hypothetical protein
MPGIMTPSCPEKRRRKKPVDLEALGGAAPVS